MAGFDAHLPISDADAVSTGGKIAPLSFAQERLWFLNQLDDAGVTYNRPTNLKLSGPLDVAALERSLAELVARHEPLRTRFCRGEPMQEVMPPSVPPLIVVDLSHLPAPQRASEHADRVRREAARPFDLVAAAPLRFQLLKLDAADQRLLFTVHHIAFDGWSQAIFMRELAAVYEAICGGEPPQLPSLSQTYVKAAARQRKLYAEHRLDEHVDYWQSQLKALPPVLALATDYDPSAATTDAGDIVPVVLPPELVDALQVLAREHRATLFMTLMAALNVLLFRYSRQEDIVVGMPIAGRLSAGVENLIGLFINTLPLRVDLSGNPTFLELLTRVRSTTIDALMHQEVPLQKIVEEITSARPDGRAPLFRTMLNLQPAPTAAVAGGVTFCDDPTHTYTSKCDLSLDFKQAGSELHGEFEYRTELFSKQSVVRIADQYLRLLDEITQRPETRIGDLPLMSAGQRREVVVDFNGTDCDYGPDRCLHEYVSRWAEEDKGRTAVVMGGCSLTYAELEARSNQLARYLRQFLPTSAATVAIYADRSPEMIVAILGVLKAGAAYVAIDRRAPAARVQFILDQLDSLVLTTHARLHEPLPLAGRPHVCLERDRDAISQQHAGLLAPQCCSTDLAYIMYTSGSTGQPKGVMVEHRSVANYVQYMKEVFDLSREDRILQFATIAFDASVEEIFGALVNGGTLVLRTEDAIDTIDGFLHRLEEWQISFVSLPTAFWHELVYQMKSQALTLPRNVKVLVIGGEKAKASALQAWREVTSDDVRLFNTYGPTEATVVSTICELPRTANGAENRDPSIGQPIANVQCYVLDPNQRPVAVGIPGELCLAGRGLSRGYFNAPELTASCFVSCSIEGAVGRRMYKTGDRVRWRDNGELEFLGRLDGQVKVRGFRVEPEEIANELEQHPLVLQSVVVPSVDPRHGTQLVAYVAAHEAPLSRQELRDFLSGRLPDYMIPSACVFMDALPLSANGKVDRNQLPQAAADDLLRGDTLQPPRTETEKLVAEVWREVLVLAEVGVADNFFDLGGHSLKATQVTARLARQLGVEVALRDLYEWPTIRQLAEHLEQSRHRELSVQVPSILEVSQARRRRQAS